MSAPTSIPEPVLHYCSNLLPRGEAKSYFGAWQDLGQYWVWSAASLEHEAPFKVRERTDNGIVELKTQGYLMHPIGAGTMHQVAHLFGYWLESDTDRIWIQIPRGKGCLYVMIWGGSTGARLKERLLWVCPECGTPAGERTLSRPLPGIDVFVNQQLQAVREFNSDITRRTCRACDFVHPLAYGFYPGNDEPTEQLARHQW